MTAKLLFILTLFSTSLLAQRKSSDYPEKYIPTDLNDALNYLDCIWSDSTKAIFKNKPEDEAVNELHMSTGMGIRNSWGLWNENSGIATYFMNLGVNHADYMSDIILRSFHRYLNKKDINIDEQIKYYKIAETEIKRMIFNEFSINDTVEFRYNYKFISQKQKNKYRKNYCIAKGLILAKDSIDLKVKVKLIESCDKKGIIIFKDNTYSHQNGIKWILNRETKIETMRVYEIKWINCDLWEKHKKSY